MKFYHGVSVFEYKESGETISKFPELDVVSIGTSYDPQGLNIVFLPSNSMDYDSRLLEVLIERGSPPMRLGRTGFVVSIENQCFMFRLSNERDATNLQIEITKALKGNANGISSVFAERTEDSSALQYFQFYGYLSQQQNMMQDYIRTATYQKAIHANLRDFADKVILDVGAGSGILSFFAVQAGAKKVYAVEASSIAPHCEALANFNGLKGKLIVLPGKIEEIELPEKVDCIISEPMGYMLYNERMLETYLHAKKWLKPGGKMFPSRGDLHVTPFSDEALFLEQQNKAAFWQQTSFHGVNLSCLRNVALKEYFRQPIVDTFDVRICLAKSIKHSVDFLSASEYDLHVITVPLNFEILETGTVHGLAFWFDVAFEGSTSTVWLSTAPTEPLTHWYQVRCLIDTPILCIKGQFLKGTVVLTANKRQSYDVLIELELDEHQKTSNTLDLKNPYFRYTGQAPQPPPGHHSTAPSDGIWATADGNNCLTRVVNGVNGPQMVDAMGNMMMEMPTPGTIMSVVGAGGQNIQLHHQPNYTTVPLIGDYVAAAAAAAAAAQNQHQGVAQQHQQHGLLLTNSSNVGVNVLPHGASVQITSPHGIMNPY